MRIDLPEDYLSRMRDQLGEGYAAYLDAMEQPPRRALRVNTCKITVGSFQKLVDFSIIPIAVPSELVKSSVCTKDNAIISVHDYRIIEKSTDNVEDITIDDLPYKTNIEKSSGDAKDNTINSDGHDRKIVKSSAYREEPIIYEEMGESNIVKSSAGSDDDTVPATDAGTDCFRFDGAVAIGRHPLHVAGLCYVQEPSAQAPVHLMDLEAGMTVLDLCAAPGGKTGQIAAKLHNTGLLISNEPVPSRAETLGFNLERLGITNAVVTVMQPDALCGKIAGLCDAVLVDAPCSGEGMFRRDPEAATEWSIEHVHACALRQRAILDAADAALKCGGTLVYSTCTFSSEENEENVAAFLAAHPAYTCEGTFRMYPHTSAGEGQFAAKLIKHGDASADDGPSAGVARGGRPKGAAEAERAALSLWDAFCRENLTAPLERAPLVLSDGRIFLPPEGYWRLPKQLRILRAGIPAGEVRQGRFVPNHALSMALPASGFLRCVPLDGDALTRYLAGETVACDAQLSGWCAVTAAGYPVGWGKAVGGTLKNHLPKGLRLR